MSTISRILVVDDEPSNRRIAELSLRHVGKWDVALASSGSEGLAVAATFRPDVILLDVMMPGMDGLEVFASLRRDPRASNVPVIFLTAMVQRENFERLRATGAAGILGKPFDPMALPGQVRRLVAAQGARVTVAPVEDVALPRLGGLRTASSGARAATSEIAEIGSSRGGSSRCFTV